MHAQYSNYLTTSISPYIALNYALRGPVCTRHRMLGDLSEENHSESTYGVRLFARSFVRFSFLFFCYIFQVVQNGGHNVTRARGWNKPFFPSLRNKQILNRYVHDSQCYTEQMWPQMGLNCIVSRTIRSINFEALEHIYATIHMLASLAFF